MPNASEVVIASAVRTPIARFLGPAQSVSAPEWGAHAVKGALERAQVAASEVDSLFFGQARQAGCGPNPARQVVRRSGLPNEVPAITLNQACASGLKALQLGVDEIRLGRASVVVAGGMESMSQVPFLLDRMRQGYRLGDAPLVDAMYRDGFQCKLANMVMGETAELLAQERGISRDQQDEFALGSQQKAAAAIAADRFRDELLPVPYTVRRVEHLVDADEHPRAATTLEKLGELRPVFDPEGGTVTAGNSSGITDGAAALVLMSAAEATRRGVQPLAAWVDSQVSGCEPERMGLGPVPATRTLMEKTGLSLDAFDLIELNEAFAAQVLAVLQDLPIESERLNVNGGAIALGHPIGCTGARIAVTLIHEMRRRGAARGLATLCVSGGLGMSALFQLP